MSDTPDFVIVGSGIGGATTAFGLAPTGAEIVILERGERLRDTPETRDLAAIFRRGVFRPDETWLDGDGKPFNPGNYYYVGGNSKFFGAVMYRLRAEDFEAHDHLEGTTVSWPFGYDELEPWYCQAEKLFSVRGQLGDDPTEPYHSEDYPFPPVPHEPQVEDAAERLRRQGLHPTPLPLSVDVEAWLRRAPTPWDAVPDTFSGKIDAETGPLARALEFPNVRLVTGAKVERLEVDPRGRDVTAVVYRRNNTEHRICPKTTILAAGAVNSAVVLLRSDRRKGTGGVGNTSGLVGRYFMNHNATALIAVDVRKSYDTVHAKTLAINDFYFADDEASVPLGNVQLLGKVSAPILSANLLFWSPEFALRPICRRALDWYLMSEDLPSAESRVYLDGGRIVLNWQPTNLKAHGLLVDRMRSIFRRAGYQLIFTKPFGRGEPSHQCGTNRMGTDPATAVLDPFCRSYDHPNLYVVDASFLPSSAAVNPSLTIAAQALRVANHLSAD